MKEWKKPEVTIINERDVTNTIAVNSRTGCIMGMFVCSGSVFSK